MSVGGNLRPSGGKGSRTGVKRASHLRSFREFLPCLATVDLGDRIRTGREAAGLSQEELAEKVGVTGRTVSNWERGVRNPRSKLGLIERVLGAQLRGRTADRAAPALPDASTAQLLGEIAGRDAEKDRILHARDATIAELRAELDAIRGGTVHRLDPKRWAARPRDNGDDTPPPQTGSDIDPAPDPDPDEDA